MSIETNLAELAERWSEASPSERSNAQLYLTELAEALDVERPRPAGSGYEFEYAVTLVARDGTESRGRIDLYKHGCFVLEAKDPKAEEPDDLRLRRAFGQARLYAVSLPAVPPPYLLVLDVGRTLMVWDRWAGSYGGYNAGRKIDLRTLHTRPDDIALLRDIWEQPQARDPRARAVRVTRDIAEKLARLTASLEERGHDPERVARFLIRSVFTMFAEDVGLLPDSPFERAIEEVGLEDPGEFREIIVDFWDAMNRGDRFGLKQFLRFNGHFFKEIDAPPLEREDLVILLEAARVDWQHVEPTIFGTLFVRALDPDERHRLGAEFTPRAYVDRVVRQAVEAPLRERWSVVQAEVLQLRTSGRKKDTKTALGRLRQFHEWLRELRFLDPACGSGNFLYATLAVVKRVELEVLRGIEEITGHPELAVEEVGPWQFHGIEVEHWAREIAELTLWIGYYQFWLEHHGHAQPPEPVLRDTGTLECRDAVLAWDEIVEDPERARPDPTPRVPHAVTGELVPDPEATLPYREHRGARQAQWPEADFIVGNPPYMGRGRQREEFGDGYVDALRAAYPDVPDNADYVMHWWYRAAQEVAAGRTMRAGLITTNSITNRHNRLLVKEAARSGANVIWAVPDHPWVDETGSAAIRVAMTVIARDRGNAIRVEVDEDGSVVREVEGDRLNADLTLHADVSRAAAEPLLANKGLSSQGFILVGKGFVLSKDEGKKLLAADAERERIIKQYLTGRDLAHRSREQFVIDFGLRSEEEARDFPVLYDIVRDRVKPQRDSNRRKSYRQYWWRFGEPRSTFRPALEGLSRFIATVETSKHRVFSFLDAHTATSHKLIWIASADAFHLGVLSSRVHGAWARTAGGRLGAGNDPVYTKTTCFDAFPFPDTELRDEVGAIAEQIDQHRKEALARDERVTMTGMYNVVEALRSGEPLSDKDRQIHQSAACGVLRDLHDDLDRLVAQSYGWNWPLRVDEILRRLVDLHDQRAAEETHGAIRWLRPEYQVPRFAPKGAKPQELALAPTAAGPGETTRRPEWPDSAAEQIDALKDIVAEQPLTPENAARRFHNARERLVRRHLETLVLVGEVRKDGDGRYEMVGATEPG